MEKADIFGMFGVDNITKISEINGGHINRTFIAETENNCSYILQSLSSAVFHRPEAVMENIGKIVRIFDKNANDKVTVSNYLCTAEGVNFIENDGEVYRVYEYSAAVSDITDRCYLMGFSFGTFIRLLSGKNTHLEITIEKFHRFSSYFSNLVAADHNCTLKKIDKGIMAKLGSVKETVSQIFTVDFPKRNVHNDAKIDNIIFGEKCTIIDLDTAMEGYAAIDYGDMIRSVCVGGQLDFTVIRDVTYGFADGLGGILTEDEIYSLYYGILYVTGELAVRYLIDYLSDEKYFKGKSSSDCLCRANELLKQLNLFITHGDDITAIIYKAFKKQ